MINHDTDSFINRCLVNGWMDGWMHACMHAWIFIKGEFCKMSITFIFSYH